jgi:hypothetical protein
MEGINQVLFTVTVTCTLQFLCIFAKKIAKMRPLASACARVCPSARTVDLLERILLNLTLQNFNKICRQIPISIVFEQR